MASAAGMTNKILAISSRRRPPFRGVGVGKEAVDVWRESAVVSVFAVDIPLLLSSRGLARAGLGHGVRRRRLPGQHQLHPGVDDLGGVRPLGAELAGPGP